MNKNPFLVNKIIISGEETTDGIYLSDGTTIVDYQGNIDAPVTTTDLTTSGDTTLGSASDDTLTVNAKLQNNLYWNLSANAGKTIKAHNHLSTSTIGAEYKYDYNVASAVGHGIWNDATLTLTGTGSVRALTNVAVIGTGITATDSTAVACYGQVRNDGTTAGNSFLSALYGIVGASAATTAKHVNALWLDTQMANTVTGSYELIYMTENGAEALDQVMYLRTPGAVYFATFETCSAYITDTTETGGTAKKIKINIDGVPHYINAYTG